MFGGMWIRPLDLYKAFRTYWLITTSGLVEIRGIVHEADRALRGIFVQVYFDSLSVHIWILGELNLTGDDFRGGYVFRSVRQGS